MTLPKVIVSSALHGLQDLRSFVDTFKHYKADTITLPGSFGKDVPYSETGAAKDSELWHMHLAEGVPFPTTQRQDSRTSDRHLVYCQGIFNENSYFLLAILDPDAHSRARTGEMASLADLAEDLRKEHDY